MLAPNTKVPVLVFDIHAFLGTNNAAIVPCVDACSCTSFFLFSESKPVSCLEILGLVLIKNYGLNTY